MATERTQPAGGVNWNTLLVCATALAIGYFWRLGGTTTPPGPPSPGPVTPGAVDTAPSPPADLDLATIIAGPDAKAVREDAAYLAAVFDYSGNRLASVDVISSWKQHDDYFKALGAIAVTGRTKGKYPLLPSALESWLGKRSTGADGQPIKFDRAAVAGWHREIAAALRRVAK